MNTFKKIASGNLGFTLVETLLAISISTGVALAVYKVLGEFQKGQLNVENRDDVNQIHREIIGKFTDRFTCTQTLIEGINKQLNTFPLSKVLNENSIAVITVPHNVGKITLTDLQVSHVDKLKNEAEIQASYSYMVAAKTITSHKKFRVEMSFKDSVFEGCISRGSLGIDPKDACDLVVGANDNGSSYFFNGKCNFAQASCEQSGRVWNKEALKCNFSNDDLESLRNEICSTLGFKYSPETSMCLPSQELLNAVNEYQNNK